MNLRTNVLIKGLEVVLQQMNDIKNMAPKCFFDGTFLRLSVVYVSN